MAAVPTATDVAVQTAVLILSWDMSARKRSESRTTYGQDMHRMAGAPQTCWRSDSGAASQGWLRLLRQISFWDKWIWLSG